MKYVFFINPTAGKKVLQGKIESDIKSYFEKNGGDYTIHITTAENDALNTARSMAETGEEITMFACGGEGTVFEVLNGVYGYSNVALGVMPCGSANDFLKVFDVPKTDFLDLDNLINGNTVDMDLIKAGEFYCLNGASFGMDAMVANDMTLFKNWPLVSGPIAYKLAVAKTFLKPLGIKAKISLDDGAPFDTDCLFAVVANAPYYGGGYKAAPKAVPCDGKLDFTLIKTISKLRAPKFLKIYESGNHEGLDYCEMKNVNSMEFWADKSVPVNLDGEIIKTEHLRFEIVKSGIKFVLPKTINVKMLTKV